MSQPRYELLQDPHAPKTLPSTWIIVWYNDLDRNIGEDKWFGSESVAKLYAETKLRLLKDKLEDYNKGRAKALMNKVLES